MAMSEYGSWEELVVGLCDLAVKYDAKTYLYESMVLLSPRSAKHGNDRVAVRVTRFDDEAARVEVGWCLDMCQWVGVFFDAWSVMNGDRWQAYNGLGSFEKREKRAVRRFPQWTTTR
jgi:hypothetical protein